MQVFLFSSFCALWLPVVFSAFSTERALDVIWHLLHLLKQSILTWSLMVYFQEKNQNINICLCSILLQTAADLGIMEESAEQDSFITLG